DGIFLTHAHIGHYTGLMYLGHEALASRQTNVYAMPGMKTFLTGNGPWSQLVKFENIELLELQNDSTIRLSSNLTIKPFLVPHRDEYSETVGYKITGPKKEVLFIPDINKWDVWDRSIVDEIKKVDYALLDATFFDGAEINHRDIREIPHPFVIESMLLFESLPMQERDKIHFIHFNHTNPLLNSESKQTKKVEEAGYNVSRFLQVIEL
ncbi:MAG: MBL fold metallo-hydrolase, partial [Fulvivirga sp.]|nr:MBL fold metallo-hydrolase [Fulvivirga sp.]